MPDFKTLTLDRSIACTPERLFQVMTDRDLRAVWSAPDDDSVVIIDEFDCRPGGREVTRCGPKEAPEFGTIGQFHVVSPEFLCFSETLIIGGETLSISLCSHEIAASGTGCTLRATLQITSLAGPEMFDDYGAGWGAALDKLATLAGEAATA
ncbi:SRPBCC domain-containing protein [Mesobacterium pallidum]|uniref:SRPBCC domain-containing protein n=1 Tax=Mesobacterium pallidum TaxID=2872037 RepID=UPI001EE32800|nr:SRPBCC domain-containing protein [Mesobacterium pallidum]